MTFVKIGENINVIKDINESGKSAKVIFNELNSATEKLTPSLTANYLANANVGKEMARNVLIAKGLRGAQLDQAMATYEAAAATTTFGVVQKSTSSITQFFATAVTQAKTSIKNFGTALKTNPLMLITTALTAVVSVAISLFHKYKQEQEEMLRTAQEAAETFESESKSIDGYAKKYQELREALIAARGDEEKTYSLKQDMLALQEELNEKYGDEYGKLNLVTDAYRDQTEAIIDHKKALAEDNLNSNQSLIATAKDEMESVNTYILGEYVSSYDAAGKAIKAIAEKYKDRGITTSSSDTSDSTFWIYLDADATNAYATINDFMTDVAKLKQRYPENRLEDTLGFSEMALKNAKEILHDYEKIYNEALKNEVITDYGRNDNVLSSGYESATRAVEAFNEAILHSSDIYDDPDVDKAYKDLQNVKSQIESNSEAWGSYGLVVDKVFNGADDRLIEFAHKIKNNEWVLGVHVQAIKDANLTDTDLAALGNSYDPNTVIGKSGTEITFDTLIAKAEYYKISIEELISMLVQLGIVQKDVTNVEKKASISKSDMIAKINSLSEGFESLDKIMSSIQGKDPFDYSLMDDAKFKDTFSDLGEPFEKFVEQISNTPKDISACQSSFDDLLTSWLNSTDILENLSENTKQLTIDMLSNMGVANAESVVTEALAQKQAELAAQKYYNEVASSALEGATINETNHILAEAEAAGISKTYLAQLELQKIAVNNAKIDTASDIDQIINLANAAGSSAEVLTQLARAKSVLGQYESGSLDLDVPGNNLLLSEAEFVIDKINSGTYDYKFKLDSSKFKSAIYGGGVKSNKGGGSKSNQPAELDAAAESVKNLKQQLDLLNADLENTDPYSEKIPILQDLIKKQGEYNAALQSQADLYQNEYQKALSALPQDLQDKISGYDNFSIDTLPDSLKDGVSKAQNYRDKWNSVTISIKQANKELEKLRIKQMELAQARLDNKIGVVQNKAADIQNQMDEAESMGLNATESQYKSLIRLSRQEEKYNQNKLTGLQAELLLLDEDEDAYYDCLSAIQDCENAISKCAQNQAAYNKAILELPIQYLEKANDSLNDELDELQDKQDDLDSAIAGVTGHLQDQIEAQQALRDEAEETAQKQIDAIQDEIDGLQKANDERKQQLDLEEKLYNLERAKNQKTSRIFRESEGGFVYEADSEAIRDAQGEYEDALFDKTISDMENKIKDIEDARDKLLDSYDDEIDRLQKIMDSWNDITDAIQRAKDIAMAGQILGSGWEDRVTSGGTGDIENVTGQYEKNDKDQTWVQQQIEDNERLIKKIEEYVEAWQMGEITIREAREEINDIVGDIMPEIEANDERVASISSYTSAWSNAQFDVASSVAAATAAAANNVDELTATEMRRQAALNYAQEWANSALSVGGSLGQITESHSNAMLAEQGFFGNRISNITAFKDTYSSMASAITSMCDGIVTSCKKAEDAMKELADAENEYGYARGTRNAKPGLHPVAEGNNPEIIIKGNGAALLAKSETHYPFAGGETVLNPTDTKKVLRGDGLKPVDPKQLVFSDTQIEKFAGLTAKSRIPSAIDQFVQKSNSRSTNISTSNVKQGSVIVNFGDLNLPQVKDPDSFTRAITDGTLKSALQQRLLRNR